KALRQFCSAGTASPSCLRRRGSAACSSTGPGTAAASIPSSSPAPIPTPKPQLLARHVPVSRIVHCSPLPSFPARAVLPNAWQSSAQLLVPPHCDPTISPTTSPCDPQFLRERLYQNSASPLTRYTLIRAK